MLVLVVDSSTPAVTAALAEVSADGVAVRASRCTVDARAHGELLAPQVDAVLADVGARPADLAAIVAGLGPGPFTGLRVGLVTAATMGQVLGVPTYGVCSLDGLGHPAAAGEPVLAASDARRREIYWAVYDGAGSAPGRPGGGGPGWSRSGAGAHYNYERDHTFPDELSWQTPTSSLCSYRSEDEYIGT
ncbi:glycoprotease [Micromonospora sp. M42]|nr:glycoprotease [Micromonospora sp. M42]